MEIRADDARAIALLAQGFIEPVGGVSASAATRLGQNRRTDLVRDMVRHLSAVQLDTISVLARSHELVAYSRFGNIGRQAVDDGYWADNQCFEYWSHAACILPVESWPLFEFRRREYRRRGIRWHDVSAQAVRKVRSTLRREGPLTTRELGGAKRGGEWWDWSDAKIAIEWLLDIGEVVCMSRRGWRRVYDLAENALPPEIACTELSDDDCLSGLILDAGRSLGVGTVGDIADVHRLTRAQVLQHLDGTGLVEISVRGWGEPAYASPEALDWLARGTRLRHRTTMLSPFDSLVWHRPRVARIFGMEHRLEAYTPRDKRQHGYFAMPVLHGGKLVSRIDPGREGSHLIAKTVTLESSSRSAISGTARALREAASWVGKDDVVLGEVRPAHARTPLVEALDR